jgi:hypothetical protein
MKSLSTFLLFLAVGFTQISAQTISQIPQAVCYQAVATDAQGIELVSQNIRVKLSILKGSSSGTEEWIETHAITTDGFGLFDLQIGVGSRSGGSRSSFSDIRWGSDKYFLKVEMDVTGGSNYILMGVNPLVSVPYALYTERANSAIFADSSTTALRAQTALTANRAALADSAATSGRANFATTAQRASFATQATNADLATKALSADTATAAHRAQTALRATSADTAAAAGRANFATTAQRASFATQATNADIATKAFSADTATAAHRAQTALRATSADTAASAGRANFAINAQRAGFASQATNADFATKALAADSATAAARSVVAQTALDDRDRDPRNEIQTMSYANNTLTLSNPGGGEPFKVNFATEAFRAPGASIDYPLGIYGEAILIGSNYTVPSGKTLFIGAVDNVVELANGKSLVNRPGMPIIPENTVISTCYCSALLVPNQPYTTPMILDLTSPTFEYTVPIGRNLIIKSGGTTGGRLDLRINNEIYGFYTGGNQSPRTVVITGGKTISKSPTTFPTEKLVLTGYLLDN